MKDIWQYCTNDTEIHHLPLTADEVPYPWMDVIYFFYQLNIVTLYWYVYNIFLLFCYYYALRNTSRAKKKAYIYLFIFCSFYKRKHVVLFLLLLLCNVCTKDSENILQYYSFLCIKVKYHSSNYNSAESFFFIYCSSKNLFFTRWMALIKSRMKISFRRNILFLLSVHILLVNPMHTFSQSFR